MRWFRREGRTRRRRPRRSRPSLRARLRGPVRVLAALAILAALAAGVHRLVHSPALAVRRVTLAGTVRLPPETVLRELRRHLGEPLLLVDIGGIRAALETEPTVRRATVARRLPDLLEARIEERVPVARARFAGRTLLVDAEGVLFPPGRGRETDPDLPLLQGLATPPGSRSLVPADRPALAALAALARITGHAPPPGTFIDLTPGNRIVLRPGRDAPVLWLDRNDPGRNLEDLFAWKDRLVDLRQGAVVDLRFASRLIVVPDPPGARER